jgi:hypothetical protein
MPPFLTNVISEDGRRVFFQTREPLLPADTNGRVDVYEWEDGRLYLISSGQSSSDSYLGDASPSGNDVFLVTRQSLVGQDIDANVDMYDVRVGGGLPSQFPRAAPPPCVGDVCYDPSPQTPSTTMPASAIFSGVGNLAPPPTPKPPTNAQKLAKALKACHSRPRKRRAGCERAAHMRYGPRRKVGHAGRSNGKRSSKSGRAK